MIWLAYVAAFLGGLFLGVALFEPQATMVIVDVAAGMCIGVVGLLIAKRWSA